MLIFLIAVTGVSAKTRGVAFESGIDTAAYVEPDISSTFDARLRFEYLTVDDGLSQSTVNALVQDRLGFMWIGTWDGLNRYDGYNFKVYKHDPDDPNSLSDNTIWSLHQDGQGILWIGTNRGLDRFDPSTGQFIRYQHDPDNPQSLGRGTVGQVYQDRAGTLWVATWRGGLSRFDPQTETFVRYVHNPDDPHSILYDAVLCLYEDSTGAFWVGTWHGLDRMDRDSGQFTHYVHDPADPNSLSKGAVRAILEDAQGRLWVGTAEGGLNRFDPQTGGFVHVRHDPKNESSLNSDAVWSAWLDHQRIMWIGTEAGLNRFDPAGERWVHYDYSPHDPYSMRQDAVSAIYEDRSGVMWFGTQANGIAKYDRAEQFVHYWHDPSDPDSLVDNLVWTIFKTQDDAVWVGTAHGLSRLDPQTGRFRHYRHDPANPDSLGNDNVSALLEDSRGILWIGTADGLDRYDPARDHFVHYRSDILPNLTDPSGPMDNHILCIYEDREGALWLGTNTRGVDRFDPLAETFKHYPGGFPDPASLWGSVIYAIEQTDDGALWIGSSTAGVNRFDPATGEITHYLSDPDNIYEGVRRGLTDNEVMAIYQDSRGLLWIGTASGLNRLDLATDTLTTYREKDGLPNDVVYGILEDEQGFLWLSTNKGLARFDPSAQSEPVTETFKYFGTRDGLQSSEFDVLAYHRADDGQMFFGGVNGFNSFYPQDIVDNPYVPNVVLTSFTQGGVPVPSEKPIEYATKITLPWPHNFFEFEFAALSFRQPDKNRYAYMLEGFDTGWRTAGTIRFCRYTNLPGGTYTLRIKGSNNDGVWNEQGMSVIIKVVPPFWRTWWFGTIVGLIVLGGVIGGYRWRVKSVEARNRELAEQVAQRTAELEQEMDQRRQIEDTLRVTETQQAVAAERSRLARDLHDAVTQTLFSAGLIAEVLPEMWEADPVEGRALLAELKQLSRGALAEMRTLLLELRPSALIETPLGDLLRQLAEALVGREGLPVQVSVEGQCNLPPDVHVALYRIAQEALNNVVKHAQARQVEVSLVCSEAPLRVGLTVRDDGKGFDRGQVPADHLGISIMQERADAIGARLDIDSAEGGGTQVSVVWEENR